MDTDYLKYLTSTDHLKRLYFIAAGYWLKKIPVKWYPSLLAIDYFMNTGKVLHWDRLNTYSEKMQWAKIYENIPIKTTLADKYLVRDWVKNLIGEEFLIPNLGVWDHFEEIDFDSLPNEFVLKTNHGTGNAVIVRDKAKINKKILKLQFDEWLRMIYAYRNGFEMQYFAITPKILADKLIVSDTIDLPDYKFMCFDGKPYYCWVDLERFSKHKRNVYNMNWELQSWNHAFYQNSSYPVEKPENFEKMIQIASKLSEGFSHVRVDLYNVKGRIYFGEMTFTNSSGYKVAVPESYDVELGKLWNIKNSN